MQPPPPNVFFYLGRATPLPVTQSMLLVSPPFPFFFFDVRLSSVTTDYGLSSRSPLLMRAQSSPAGITALLGHPVKIPIRLSSALSARRPAGDTKARGQCMQFSVRCEGDGNGKRRRPAPQFPISRVCYPTENIPYDLGEWLM